MTTQNYPAGSTILWDVVYQTTKSTIHNKNDGSISLKYRLLLTLTNVKDIGAKPP